MICPACSNKLTETQIGRVMVDVCHGGCGGIWFDAFELQQVDEPHESAGEPLLNIPKDATLHVDFTRKRACPRCEGIKLKRHFFSPKRRVEVDHCPNCGGYWLDAGELEKIREEKQSAAHRQSSPAGTVSIEIIRYLYRTQAGAQPRTPSQRPSAE